MKKLAIRLCIIMACMIVVLICVYPMRRTWKAKKAAEEYSKETGISVEYQLSKLINTKKTFFQELINIALWEEQTKEQLNQAFSHTDEEYKERFSGQVSGFSSSDEELLAFAMERIWREKRDVLYSNTRKCLGDLIGRERDRYGVNYYEVFSFYGEGKFATIAKIMMALDREDTAEAYRLLKYEADNYKTAWAANMIYTLYSDQLIAGAEETLDNAYRNETEYGLEREVKYAETFQNRYNISLSNYKKASSKAKRQECARRPEIPSVGMTTSQARSTKLGAPTKTTKQKGSWMHKEHTYGDMFWYRNDVQIFRAYYYDGKIEAVYDSRNAKPRKYYSYGSTSGSSSSSSSFDPDDHDIEAYYEDNRDEYDDYDDAYEGFLDDKGAWDDY